MKKTTSTILESIGTLYENAKECKLDASFFEKNKSQLELLANYFGGSENQALLIAIVFSLNYKGDTVDIRDLIDYFDCNPMRMLSFHEDIESLVQRNLFKKVERRNRFDVLGTSSQYTVERSVSQAILKNQSIAISKSNEKEDIFSLLEKIYNLGKQRDDEEISTLELLGTTDELIDNNLEFPLIKTIDSFSAAISDKFLYIYLIWKTITGNESSDLGRVIEGIFENASTRLKYMQGFLSKQNPLIQLNYIELEEASFFNDTGIKLTAKSFDLLKENGIDLFHKQMDKENIILPEKTAAVKLIYNDEEFKQIDILQNLLSEEKLTDTQERLKAKGLPVGVTILLHGSPGTGKTETVKQLAKQTNRRIMKVDMSKTKSMWYGESQKKVKKIFTDYKAFAKSCGGQTPILLFNEADALISKRGDISSSSTSQTENTIQNILLEELENFEGIFMATTNLASNMDTAFERRFLFKIKFKKPTEEAKSLIWQHYLPQLSSEQSRKLAQQYDFSGGQIQNILRKAEIEEILHGKQASFEDILQHCSTELLTESKTAIGFVKA